MAIRLPPTKKPARQSFPFPWGLLVVLGLYAGAVYLYIRATYWDAPEYQAAIHYGKAVRILGVDDGRKCSQPDLERALDHVLEAAKLMPDVKGFAEESERLRWRFDERKFTIPEELKRRTELVSKHALFMDQQKKPWLIIGSRDKGWAPDQLLEGPQKTIWYAIPGGFFIVAFWVYTRFSGKAARDRERDADLKRQEDELAQLGEFRSGLSEGSEAPASNTVDEDDDDEGGDTVADPPPKQRPPSQSRPAVARPPTGQRAAVRRPPTGQQRAVSRPPTGQQAAVSRPPTGQQAAVSRPPTGARGAVERKPPTGARPAVARRTGESPEGDAEQPRERPATGPRPSVERSSPVSVSSATAPPPRRKG